MEEVMTHLEKMPQSRGGVWRQGGSRNNETAAKYLQEYEQFAEDLSIGERIELINDLVKYQDKEIFMLVERDYLLRKGIAIVMISNKLQVENYSQMANDLILKIHQIASSLRQRGD
nr:hypothetical protein [Tanacetum cinerariifolium]